MLSLGLQSSDSAGAGANNLTNITMQNSTNLTLDSQILVDSCWGTMNLCADATCGSLATRVAAGKGRVVIRNMYGNIFANRILSYGSVVDSNYQILKNTNHYGQKDPIIDYSLDSQISLINAITSAA